MDQETSTAKAVRLSTDRMYDEACKRLFAEKEILAWIIKIPSLVAYSTAW